MPIITPEQAIVETLGAGDGPTGPATDLKFSDSGGLTQFGAFVQTLPPGSRSSLCHWHQNEDEFIYMIEGSVTVHEADTGTVLFPGQAACFKAGVSVGHYLRNDGTTDARYLVVGHRAAQDIVTYPDHDRILRWTAATREKSFTTLDGTPAHGSAYDLPDA